MTDSPRPTERGEPLRIIYAGTPDFAVPGLAALLDSSHQIVAVYTQPDRPSGRGRKIKPGPVKQLALEHDIPVYQPLNLRNEEDQQQLAALKPDLMVVAAYGLILPKVVLDTPTLGCVNIHASLLPRWRGASPIQQAVLAGDTDSGVTIMQMDIGLDTGDMLVKDSCTIEPTDSAAALHDKLAALGAPLLLTAIDQLITGDATPEKQDDSLSTYAPKILKQDALIDWNQTATQISRQVRAYNNWPIAYTQLGDERVRIWEAQPVDAQSSSAPGTVLSCQPEGIQVACGIGVSVGVLNLERIQFTGGKALTARDIFNANKVRIKEGDLFDSPATEIEQPGLTP
ncbi:MAG: methionyl-tRNA formyltransferase [Pseudomonadales bacterium]|nr:methionyl-tRNA formyltransferase [Pseudomonadales bacterium]